MRSHRCRIGDEDDELKQHERGAQRNASLPTPGGIRARRRAGPGVYVERTAAA
jgi:hypothetical protein